MSWLVSKNDLEMQKRKAIESILSKGDKLQIRLKKKTGKAAVSDNEIEARTLLLEKIKLLVQELGGKEAQPPQGSIKTSMLLFYEKDTK